MVQFSTAENGGGPTIQSTELPYAPAFTGADPREMETRLRKSSTSHSEPTGGNNPKVQQATLYPHQKGCSAYTGFGVCCEAPDTADPRAIGLQA